MDGSTPTRRSRSVTCTNHCCECGSHFSSTGAFDAHRVGDPDGRRCIDPEDAANSRGEPVLIAKSEKARCDLRGNAGPVLGITVWALRSDLLSAPAPWQQAA